MWFTNSFRNILMAVVTITQIDIALSGMLMSEFVSIFTIRHLLNTKVFLKKLDINNIDNVDDVDGVNDNNVDDVPLLPI